MKKMALSVALCVLVPMSAYMSFGAALNNAIDALSAGIAPNTTGALPKGGFPISRMAPATPFNGINQIGCANGEWGYLTFPIGAHGSKCLIQYNTEDYSSAHGLFVVAKNVPGSNYPFIEWGLWNNALNTASHVYAFQNVGGWMENALSPTAVLGSGPQASSGVVVMSNVLPSVIGGNYGIHANWGMARGYYGATDADTPDLTRMYGHTNCCPMSGTEVLRVPDNGHLSLSTAGSAGVLSVASCGIAPTITGGDTVFTIKLGSGNPSACTVLFKHTWNVPEVSCFINSETDVRAWSARLAGSAHAWTGVTFTASSGLSDASRLHGWCVGQL